MYNAITLLIFLLAHSCRYPGCGTAFVLDGNQKNRRDVCAATHAGEIEYEGLPGSIQSGCQLSPMYRSKYCFHHSPRVVRSCEPLSSSGEDGTSDRENVVRFITGKRSTRSGVTYQVYSIVWWWSLNKVHRRILCRLETG